MENNKIIKRRKRFSAGEAYDKTIICKVTIFEYRKIKEYCISKNISKSRLMTMAAMYFIDNNIDIDEINVLFENYDDDDSFFEKIF